MNIDSYAVVNTTTGLVENIVLWEGATESGWMPPEDCTIVLITDMVHVGWSYESGVFTPPVAPDLIQPSSEEILASQSVKLQAFIQLASAQKAALSDRISTLNDSIELEIITPAEEVELPLRVLQLTEWKTYAVLLGRITTQVDWPVEVEWPVQPATGMDLTVSATVPKTM